MKISEVTITPVKPDGKGLIAFASCIVEDSLYLGSIGVLTKLKGGYKILFPTKKLRDNYLHYFHPISSSAGNDIESAIIKEVEAVFG